MIYKNAQENIYGSIDCLILLNGEWVPTTQDPSIEYELSEELGPDDWPDIKPCDQAEKTKHEQEQAISQAVSSVQAMLDAEAASRGYDNINAIGKYIGYDNPFRAECEALGAWTASCWAKCYELQSGGVIPADLLAEMPLLELAK